MTDKMNIKCDDLGGSQFDNVNLAGTTFHNVNLAGSTFDDINLSGATYHNINFSDVTFSAAQLGGTVFKHLGLPPGSDGKHAHQRGVVFEEAHLNDSVFRQVDLSRVKIEACNIEGMTIDGVLVSEALAAFKKSQG